MGRERQWLGVSQWLGAGIIWRHLCIWYWRLAGANAGLSAGTSHQLGLSMGAGLPRSMSALEQTDVLHGSLWRKCGMQLPPNYHSAWKLHHFLWLLMTDMAKLAKILPNDSCWVNIIRLIFYSKMYNLQWKWFYLCFFSLWRKNKKLRNINMVLSRLHIIQATCCKRHCSVPHKHIGLMIVHNPIY